MMSYCNITRTVLLNCKILHFDQEFKINCSVLSLCLCVCVCERARALVFVLYSYINQLLMDKLYCEDILGWSTQTLSIKFSVNT